MVRFAAVETFVGPFVLSATIVALAEMGDKTQLLALVLAAKFRRPVPIVLGILTATLANHTLAGAVGAWITHLVGPSTLRWAVGLSFLTMGIWTLVPDKLSADDGKRPQFGVFGTVLAAFFIAEMGDKTQIATVALAAQYQSLTSVVLGTTLGMMIANVPAVILGDRLANRLPIRLVRTVAALLFVALGAWVLVSGHDVGSSASDVVSAPAKPTP